MTPILAEAETFSKPGTADVTAGDRKKLAPLIRHYGKMAHPFTSCKRDQLRHGLSEQHANRRCSVLKSLSGREEEEAVEELLEEAESRLASIAEVIGEETVGILVESESIPGTDSLMAEVANEIADCSALLEFYGPMLTEAYAPPSWAVPAKSKGVTSKGTRIGGKDDPEFEKKHPRAQKGSPTGGKFVQKGGSGEQVSAVQDRLGVKATGTFDEATRRAVIAFQKKNGLKVDGIVGRQTAAAMLGNSGASKIAPGSLRSGQARRLIRKNSSSSSSRSTTTPKPISAPSEDSLPTAKTDALAKKGWDYHDGHWYPPGHPRNKKRATEADLAENWTPGVLMEEVVDVEKRTRDDGTVTATYDRVRSALWDLERESSKTTEVRLPHGVRVTARQLPPPPERPYGLKRTEFTVVNPDGRRQKCANASEASEYAKDWDVEVAVKPAVPAS